MIIYIENQIAEHPRTQTILSKFPHASKIHIDHYKNLFDKDIGGAKVAPALLLAKSPRNPITRAPANYGYTPHSFFFKASINCIFDCQYCYLKGAFKSRLPVIFVDYEEIAKHIEETISQYPGQELCFYGSNYAGSLATEQISGFHEFFIPLFEQFPKVIFESRTKSHHITPILEVTKNFSHPPQNFEIAFSLNPREICETIEKGASSLDQRISAIRTCLDAGLKVGVRFLPLLPVQDYQKIYTDFLEDLTQQIDFSRLHSIFLGPLLYTRADFAQMQKHYPTRDLRSYMEDAGDGFVRVKSDERQKLLQIFTHVVGERVVQFG